MFFDKNCWYESASGERCNISNRYGIMITSADGLFDACATANMSEIAGYSGGTFISSSVPVRHGGLTLHSSNIEDRPRIKRAFRVEESGALFYQDEYGKTKNLHCICTGCDIPPFQYDIEAQITLVTEDPFWKDAISVPTVMATLTPNWEYPLKIEGDAGIELSKIDPSLIAKVTNTGQLPTGCVFEIRALGNLENPKLQDINTFKFIGAELSLAAGDVLLIDTRLGKKSLTKISGKVKKDVFNCLMEDSVFLQLAVGDNEFRRFADGNEDNMEVICRHENLSAGV